MKSRKLRWLLARTRAARRGQVLLAAQLDAQPQAAEDRTRRRDHAAVDQVTHALEFDAVRLTDRPPARSVRPLTCPRRPAYPLSRLAGEAYAPAASPHAYQRHPSTVAGGCPVSNETSHQTLENLGHEDRPSRRRPSSPPRRTAPSDLYAQADADYEGVLGRPGPQPADVEQGLHAGRSTGATRRSRSGSPTASSTSRYNCVDRHVEAGNGDKVAIHFVGEPDGDTRDITYADLHAEVQQRRERARGPRRRQGRHASRSTCR